MTGSFLLTTVAVARIGETLFVGVTLFTVMNRLIVLVTVSVFVLQEHLGRFKVRVTTFGVGCTCVQGFEAVTVVGKHEGVGFMPGVDGLTTAKE